MQNDPVYLKIGRIIQARRKALGMKQEELAQKLGISRGGLANIETGRQNMLVHQLYRFAASLECAPQELLPPPTIAARSMDDSELDLPTHLKTTQRQQVAEFIANVTVNQPLAPSNSRERKPKH